MKNITYNDVIDLYNEIFQNGQGQVTVSGDFTKYPELRQTIFNNTALYSKAQPRDISLEKRTLQLKNRSFNGLSFEKSS